MLPMFRAYIRGIVNWVLNMPKLVFIGDTLTFTVFSPTVNCHQGLYTEISITRRVKVPPMMPNQLILDRCSLVRWHRFVVNHLIVWGDILISPIFRCSIWISIPCNSTV
jgi:hypothetical protein